MQNYKDLVYVTQHIGKEVWTGEFELPIGFDQIHIPK